ncbi:GNAT family N-acetyltransferase [Salinarimonas ramus]|uniref:N-acetyltransferase n=1 Tax=Salinarimonas ramus TaxID=690164 RepID=A0A917V1Y7_9HYPH|nr:GNAT family N-acetyltransferase [Salinarimonas ramus]GGK18144.1 N-acetyltransferase [Salinarimonas ramus]
MPDAATLAPVTLRPATPADARTIAVLWDMANAGHVASLFARGARGRRSWLDDAADEIGRPAGEMSWKNAVVAEHDGDVVGALVALRLTRRMGRVAMLRLPPDQRSHYELLAQVHGAYFLRDLAVMPEHRGRGIGSALIDAGVGRARAAGCETLAITTHETNESFRAHLERRGFTERDTRPVRLHARYAPQSRWILLARPVAGA